MKKNDVMTIVEIAVKTSTSIISFGGTLLSCIIDEVKSKSKDDDFKYPNR